MRKSDQWIRKAIQVNEVPKSFPFYVSYECSERLVQVWNWRLVILRIEWSKSKMSLDSGHSCARTNCQSFADHCDQATNIIPQQ